MSWAGNDTVPIKTLMECNKCELLHLHAFFPSTRNRNYSFKGVSYTLLN